jgi:hypothetical protein
LDLKLIITNDPLDFKIIVDGWDPSINLIKWTDPIQSINPLFFLWMDWMTKLMNGLDG